MVRVFICFSICQLSNFHLWWMLFYAGTSSDWWCVGAVIYFLLMGENVFSNYPLTTVLKNISKNCCKEALQGEMCPSLTLPVTMLMLNNCQED